MFSVAAAIEGLKLAMKVVDNLTDAEQQELRASIKASKRALKKERIARKIFDGMEDQAILGDNAFIGTDIIVHQSDFDEGTKRRYLGLKDEFNDA